MSDRTTPQGSETVEAVSELDAYRCPHCGADATSFGPRMRQRHRLAHRERHCGACSRRYSVFMATTTNNPLLCDVLEDYIDRADAGEPTGAS